MLTAAPSVLGRGRFFNGNKPMLSGSSQGTVAKKKKPGAKRPAGTIPGNKTSSKEKDERPVRKKIEMDRRPLNYGNEKPKYRPDQAHSPKKYSGLDKDRGNEPNAPVIKKGIPKPAKAKGRVAKLGASVA